MFLVLVGVYLASAGANVFFGGMNPDEGFYALAARAVMAGEVPYRDFGYTQMPLLPYLNGPLLALAGYGLWEQRLVNGLWCGLGLLLIGIWLARRRGAPVAAFTLLLFPLNAPWMYFMHLGKTYAFTGLVCSAAGLLHLELAPGWRKGAILGALGVLGVGCRLPAAPFFTVLWLAALGEAWTVDRRRLWLAVVIPLGVTALLLGPFWLAAPDTFLFWVFEFHRLSLPSRNWQLAWREIAMLAPALWLAAVAALFVALRRPAWTRAHTLAVAAGLTLASNLLPRGIFEEYAVPYLPSLALAVVWILIPRSDSLSGLHAARLAIGLLLAQLLAAPIVNWSAQRNRGLSPSAWLTLNAPDYNPRLPVQLARATALAKQQLGSGGRLAGSNLILAGVASELPGADLRMGPFAVTAELPEERAAKLHLATPRRLAAIFADPRTRVLAFFNRPLLNYAWSMPSFANVPEVDRRIWVEIFRREYMVVYQEGDFLLLARVPLIAPPEQR
jgi:hypothetical protein